MKRALILSAGLLFFLMKSPCQPVIDYDGNVYDTVVTGSQTWLVPNLRVTHYSNGDPVPNVTGSVEWANLLSGARCYYNNDSATNDSVYGPLYNWYAVSDPRGLCPDGWHVSANSEWQETESFLGGIMAAGGKMKESGTLHWLSPNYGATNETGFTALPGGVRLATTGFQFFHENGVWWTRSSYGGTNAWAVYMWYQFAGTEHDPWPKTTGLSVRCLKDVTTPIEEGLLPRKVRIHPNPCDQSVTVESCSYESTVIIFDPLGKPVIRKNLTKNIEEINTGFLPEGIYMLKVSSKEGIFQAKLLKR